MNYFSFDAETDGLYGEAFAIGAVVMDEDKNTLAEFSGMAQPEKVTDAWTIQHVLPALDDLERYDTRADLREAFWTFYMQHKEDAVIVADVPYPVEAGLLRACVQEQLKERMWHAPYPLIDVASVLFTAGYGIETDRAVLCGMTTNRHHPLDDAKISLLAMLKVLDSKREKS